MNTMTKFVKIKRGVSLSAIFAIIGIFLLIAGFFVRSLEANKDKYLETTATVEKVYSESDVDDSTSYYADIKYYVDNQKYEVPSWTVDSDTQVGDKITILYNPENPETIMSTGADIHLYMIILGIAAIAAAVFFSLRSIKNYKKREEDDKALESGAFDDGYQPTTEKKYYFLLDKKFFKQGAYMETADRVKVCEAVVKKFSPIKGQTVDFVNHMTCRTVEHNIGNTTSVGDDSIFDAAWFKIDGENIWDYLHSKGIRITTKGSIGVIGFTYEVTRNGKPYGIVTTSSVNVHEEDSKGKILDNLVARGFYKVTAFSDDLDLLFLTTYAFYKSGQTIND